MRFQTGQFAGATAEAGKVLVVDLGFLGDAIHLLPSLWDLRRHYGNAAFDFLGSSAACEVLGLTRCVDKCWSLEMRREKRTAREQWRVVRAVREEGYEVAINLNAADRSIILTAMTGAKHRLALQGGRWHAWNRWLIPHWLAQPDRSMPVYEQLRRALCSGGFQNGDLRFGLEAGVEARGWAEQHVPGGALHISLCASGGLKEWPVERYADLARALRERFPGMAIVASASGRAREQARMDEFFRQVGDGVCARLPSDMSLERLVAVLERCRLHVGPDSGVVHVAVALGLQTLSYFRRRGEGWRGWVPKGSGHRAFLQDCHCARDRDAACRASGVPECLASLEASSVFEACEDLLSGGDKLGAPVDLTKS